MGIRPKRFGIGPVIDHDTKFRCVTDVVHSSIVACVQDSALAHLIRRLSRRKGRRALCWFCGGWDRLAAARCGGHLWSAECGVAPLDVVRAARTLDDANCRVGSAARWGSGVANELIHRGAVAFVRTVCVARRIGAATVKSEVKAIRAEQADRCDDRVVPQSAQTTTFLKHGIAACLVWSARISFRVRRVHWRRDRVFRIHSERCVWQRGEIPRYRVRWTCGVDAAESRHAVVHVPSTRDKPHHL